MIVLDVSQGSPEWLAARAGLPTASMFATVMASGRGGGESKTRRTYMRKLAGEIITGLPMESYSNGYMDRGKAMEDEARRAYSFMTDAEPNQVGFIVNGPKGCSPDSLIGADGALEIKTMSPHLLIDVLDADVFPPEHKAQCQGVLWVCERDWIDLAVYFTGMPLFVKRAYRDPEYIRALSDAVDLFNEDLARTVEFVRAYGRPAQQVAA